MTNAIITFYTLNGHLNLDLWNVCSSLLSMFLLDCLLPIDLWKFFIYLNSLLDIYMANISSYSTEYLFILLMVSFEEQKFLLLM